MKKFITLLFILFTLSGYVFSKDTTTDEKTPNMTFVYINGSNNNDEKMKNWYLNGVKNFHPAITKKLNKNAQIKAVFDEHNIVIDPDPHIFFWGYDSKTDLNFVKERLDISKAVSSFLAYKFRKTATEYLHDALWVIKDPHMLKVIDDLNNEVIGISKKDNRIILFGYSAGTFITYQYMNYKLPYINLYEYFEALNMDAEFMNFVKSNPRKNTCLSALTADKGDIGVMSNTGHFYLNNDRTKLKENYLKIDEATERYCAPEGTVKGIISFASPLPLFYSEIGNEEYELNYYSAHMIKYIYEHGIYWITINFKDDPLGFPTSRNLTIDQVEERIGMLLDNPTGVIYDDSKAWSMRTELFAHTSYWNADKIFTKSLIKALTKGTKFIYDEQYQKQQLNRKIRKDPELLYE